MPPSHLSRTALPCVVLATVVFAALAHADLAPAPATHPLVPGQKVGQIAPGKWLLPTGQIIAPAGRQADLAGIRPQALALSPNGKIPRGRRQLEGCAHL